MQGRSVPVDTGFVADVTNPMGLLFTQDTLSRKPLLWWAGLSVFCVLALSCFIAGGSRVTWSWRHFQMLSGSKAKDSPHKKEHDDVTESENESQAGKSPRFCDTDTDDESNASSPGGILSAFVEGEVESYASGKLYEQYVKDYWARYSFQEEPDVFGHDNLRIATDGGMGRVSELKVKYLKAAQVVGTGFLNGVLILVSDIAALTGMAKMTYGKDDFLIVKWLANSALPESAKGVLSSWLHDDINMLVPALELFFTAYVVVTIFVYTSLAILAPRLSNKHGEMYRWSFASHVAWYCGPQLASCSALRLLYFVWPKILRLDGHRTVVHAWQTVSKGSTQRHYADGIFNIVVFGLSRVCALILGFDAFLVKFRLASNALDAGQADFYSTLSAAAFLWQVGGIINLDWFVRERGFIFIFAGRNGMLDIDELALVEVWKAMLFRKVVENHGIWEGIIVMLGFDDYDMQFLALDDDERIINAAISSRALSSYSVTPRSYSRGSRRQSVTSASASQ